jgi:WD40-like Beta Propeller Repeat
MSTPDSRTRLLGGGGLTLTLVILALAVPALAAGSEASCPNEQRRSEQPLASALPDCRAYEMVSPLAKGDNSVDEEPGRAAASGEAVSYFSVGSFAEPKAAVLYSAYLSRREADGWSTRNISPPFTDYAGTAETLFFPFEEQLFTEDLSRGIVESPYTPLVSGQPIGYVNLYVANTEMGAYEAVTTVTPEKEDKPFTESIDVEDRPPEAEGGSSDLSHVVFQQNASLCCGASPHQGHVYEWADGSLRQVDVTPTGGQFAGPSNVGASASRRPSNMGNPWRAVSSDGLRVVFTGGEALPGAQPEWGQVYVRENPMSAVEDCAVAGDACTVAVSASQRTNGKGEPDPDPNAGKNPSQPPVAWYRDASVDGSRVFFTSRVELTNDANTGPEDNAGNLYEYNVESGILTDLTVDTNTEDVDGAGVLGLVTASEDGSYVYFVAEGKLTSEANSEGDEAVSGKPNLYLAHAGRVTFIATLAPGGDEKDWIGEEFPVNHDYGPGAHTARVTPDGTRLAFESELSLTKYDNEAAGPGECENERCREVYLYDAMTGKLICASCGPRSDERPVGPSGLTPQYGHYYLPRNLSENGRRLFFETTNPLVSSDSNGRLDVYEWEQVGEGSCTIASASYAASEEGCTFPLSDVTGALKSDFLDASANGNDVFIVTADQLMPSDTDARDDVYDVRVGGGFPVAGIPSVCEGADSCRPPISTQPSGLFGTPASQAFSGPGNPAAPAAVPVVKVSGPRAKPARCRKGSVEKRGRCVKRKRRAATVRRARKSGFDGRGR